MARGLRGRNDPPVTLFAFQDVMTAIIGILLFVVLLMAVQTSAVANAVGERSDEVSLRDRVAELQRRKSAAAAALDSRAKIAEQARQSDGFNGVVRDRAELARVYAEIEKLERAIASKYESLKQRTGESANADTAISAMVAAQQENEKLKGELDVAKLNKRLTYIVSKNYDKRPVLIEISDVVWRVSADANGDTMISLNAANLSERIDALLSVLDNFSPREFYCLLIVKPSAASQVSALSGAVTRHGFNLGLDAIPEEFTGMIDPAGVTP